MLREKRGCRVGYLAKTVALLTTVENVFHVNKCEVIYEMFNKILDKVDHGKHLEVYINNNSKISEKFPGAFSKVNKIFGLISRNFWFLNLKHFT